MVEIIGSGGGKSGSSYRSPVEAPNTLQSNAEVTIVEALSTGPIVGLVNGEKDIYFNETPLMTEDGTLTYQDVSWDIRTGTPDQEEFPSVAGIETTTSVGVEVTHYFPKGTSPTRGNVSRSLTNINATHVRIILGVPALYYQEIDDEDRVGDTSGTEISYSIYIENSLGTTIVSYSHSRTDKTMSSAQWAHKFALDGNGPWIVTVAKETADSEISNLNNDLNWSAFVEIIGYPMIYPYLAVAMVKGSAETFGESIPARCYNIKGKIISVPSNYTPSTRNYAGVWDGTFKQEWTDNPAWVFYDIVMSDRYGLSKFFPAHYKAWLTLCDKWGLYEIAQLCDELVSDGYGGTEPRYSFNMQILGSGTAAEVLQSVASAFHGLTYWASGSIFVRTDFPQDAVMTLTQANVEGGLFTYETGSLQECHSVVLVSWNDPDDFGNSRIEPVIDWDLYSTVGYRPINMTAYGCNSRGLAHRHGKWLLATEKEQWQCEVNAGLDSFGFVPGDFVRIADPKWMGYRFGGRIIAIDETKKIITLDAPVTLDEAETYQLGIALPDGTEEYSTVTSTGTVTDIVVSTAFSLTPIDGSVWHLSGTSVAPRIFAIRSIKEETKGKISISLREVNPGKYTDIESDVFLTDTPGAIDLKGAATAPSNLTVTESSYIANGLVSRKLIFSWQGIMDSYISGYEIIYQDPKDDWTTLPVQKYFNIAVSNAYTGDWIFKVRTRLVDGRVSTWAVKEYTLEASSLAPAAPTDLAAEVWFGTVILSWTLPSDTLCKATEIYAGTIDDVTSAVQVGLTVGSQFKHHVGSFVGHYYWIRSLGSNGIVSDWSQTAGVWAKTDQDSHQDFVDLVLQENPYLTGVQTDLNTGIEKISLDEELVAQGLIDAMLNAREGKQESDVAIALAKREISTKVVEGLSAEASERLLLAAIVGGNIAAIQSEATARANADSALASSVSTVQTTVGNNTSAIQIIDSSVDGIQSKHAVKIDTNGYVTGYELIGTGASSSMVFHVDNFLVGKVGSTNQYPFVIGTVDGVSRVSMASAFIQDASIKAANIANATIERLKIVGHTLTEVASYYASAQVNAGSSGWENLASITITTEAGYSTPIVFTAALQAV